MTKKQQAVADINSVAKKIGRVPARFEYRARKNKGHLASSTIEDRFGGSWRRAARNVR